MEKKLKEKLKTEKARLKVKYDKLGLFLERQRRFEAKKSNPTDKGESEFMKELKRI